MLEWPPVLTKRDFTRRYAMMEFGNGGPTWSRLDEFIFAHPEPHPFPSTKLYHLRNRVAGGPTYYNLILPRCMAYWKNQTDKSGWYVSEMAPTEATVFQGEVMQGINGLDLYYTTVAKPMRDALRERSESVSGIIASSLLRRYLCPRSLDWLNVLLERYPGHVVEFSTYSVCWGTLPGYNTVFWEVRSY